MAVSVEKFVKRLSHSGLMTAEEVSALTDSLPAEERPTDGQELARLLLREKKLTKYQATAVYKGQTGGLVLGNYIVLEQIGEGGMGQVLKAQHKRMKRMVAVKVLPREVVSNPDALDRFHREVEAAAKLNHPNIVTAHDADEAGGIHFLVMEHVDGKDLSVVLKEHGPLPLEQAVECILQAARGLAFAHEHGVVHRDIKPGNLILSKDGTVKILDMGLARIDSNDFGDAEATAAKQLTQSGQMMGTVDYMSPEQAEDTRVADHRADIYSLGCTMYRLLTGSAAFEGDTVMKKLLAHRDAPIPSLCEARADVPEALDEAFAKMLAKDPADRQQSMVEVIAEIEASLDPDQAPQPLVSEDSSSGGLTEFFDHLSDQSGATGTEQKAAAIVTENTIEHRASQETDTEIRRRGKKEKKKAKPQLMGTAFKGNRTLVIAGGAGLAVIAVVLAIFLTRGEDPVEEADSASRGESPPATTAAQVADEVDMSTPANRWTSLFNGKDLSGWTPIDTEGDWSVENGVLTGAAGARGWLSTNREYSDFELELEYQINAGGNSGIFLRAPRDGNLSGADFLEIQLLHDSWKTFQNLDDTRVTGGIFKVVPVKQRAVVPHQKWHKAHVRAVGSRITVTINGVTTVDADLANYADEAKELKYVLNRSGFIGLQLMSAVEFRNIRIRDLSGQQATTNLDRAAGTNYALEFDGKSSYVELSKIDISDGPVTVETIVVLNKDRKTTVMVQLIPPQYQLYMHEFGGWKWNFSRGLMGGRSQFVQSDSASKVERQVHVAGVWDGDEIALFIDGKRQIGKTLITASPLPATLPSRTFIGVAADPANGDLMEFHDGIIDEVRISNVARYDKDYTPAKRFEPDGNTLALYHFDEGRGDVLQDSSGNGLHGKIVGARWVRADAKGGIRSAEPRIVRPIDGWLDLHALFDPPQDIVSGQWTGLPGGVLRGVHREGDQSPASAVAFPIRLNGGYELALKFRRTEGNNAVNVQLPVCDTSVTFMLAAFPKPDGSALTGLHKVDGKYLPDNSTAIGNLRIEQDREYRLSITVEPYDHDVQIAVKLDDKTIFDWKGASSRLQPADIYHLTDPRKLGLGVIDSEFQYSNLRLRMVSGEATQLRPLSDPDRAAAEWVLGIGGTVKADAGTFVEVAQLPKEPFQIVGVYLIGNQQVTDANLEHLKNLANLTRLKLDGTQISDLGLEHLNGLTNLTELYLNKTHITDTGMEHLNGLTKLTNLSLQNTQVSDAGLMRLKGLENLRLFTLTGTPVRGAGLEHFGRLTSLVLKGTRVSDTDLEHLKGLTNLSWLYLADTQVSDAGLEQLKELKELESLNLENTQVTAQGVADLKNTLPNCNIIWDGNTDPDRAAAEWVLGIGGSIETEKGEVTEVGQLPEQAFQIVAVNLRGMQRGTDDDLKHLKGLKRLHTLQLNHSQIGDAGLEHLNGLSNLFYLQLNSSQVSDAGMKHLKRLPKLNQLLLDQTKVGDAGLEHLKGLTNLTHLTLYGTQVSDSGLEHLKGLTKLRGLNLSKTKVTAQGVADLKKALPKCKITGP